MGFTHRVVKQLLVDHASVISRGEGASFLLVPASPRESFDGRGFGYVSIPQTSHHGERDMYSYTPDLGHMPIVGAKA